ncbi:hypothetical protein JH302_11970 [Xanthomonas campestris]|uniref:hypothetical protein n=1 Tax=Xanthomonas campestris TaxID=339 RepID=UPI002379F683|nr:hypothetical protein [Xanthomonas campestris]WDJ88046.1 hypothetical protein JH302_11970 [Xanthomonas campestris]
MQMPHFAPASHLPAGAEGQGGSVAPQCERGMTHAQRRQFAGRCTSASVVASIVFNFMRTLRSPIAPRIA